MKVENGRSGVNLAWRMISVGIVVVMCLSAFGVVLPAKAAGYEQPTNNLGNASPISMETSNNSSTIPGPWIAGNVTLIDGSIPQSVTLRFFNHRTSENAVNISHNGTYLFGLQNFSQGYEIGDVITIEALDNTGDGKINTGNVTLTITDTDQLWADIILLDPQLPEAIQPTPSPNGTTPGGGNQTTWIELVSLVMPPGNRYAIVDQKANS